MATEYELTPSQESLDYIKQLEETSTDPYAKKAAKLADRYAQKQQKLGYDTAVSPQQNLSDAVDVQIYTRPDGSLYQLDYMLDDQGVSQGTREVDYTQLNKFGQPDVRDLYIDDTVEGNYKLGLARTDQGGFEGRYDPAVHPDWKTLPSGELAGPRGVTRDDGALMNITLPRDYATQFEYGVHSDPEQIKNRVIGTGPVTEQDILDFGAGKTEYTTPNAPMWNVDSVDTGAEITPETPLPKEPRYYNDEQITPAFDLEAYRAATGSSDSRLENLLEGAQYGIGRTAAGIGDAIVDASARMLKEGVKTVTGKTEEEANKYIKEDLTFAKDWFNDKMDFTALDEYKEAKTYGYDPARTQAAAQRFSEAYQSDSVLDMASSVVEGIITAGPEYFVESAGEFVAAASGYGLLPLAGKYSNDILEDREKITGRPATGLERAAILPLGVLVAATNKLGADELFSRSGLVNKVVDTAIASNSKSAAKQVLTGVMKSAATVAGKGTYEGLEEVVQESLQKFGEKYGTEAQEELTSSKMGEELFQAFAGGVAGGATMTGASEVVGAVAPAKEVSDKLFDKVSELGKSKRSKEIDAEQEKSVETIAKEFKASMLAAAGAVSTGNQAEAYTAMKNLDVVIDSLPEDMKQVKNIQDAIAQREVINDAFMAMAQPIVDDVIGESEEITPDTVEKIRALGSTRTPGGNPEDVNNATYDGIVEQAIRDAQVGDVVKNKLLAVARALDVTPERAQQQIDDTLIVNEMRKTMDEVTQEEETSAKGYKTYFEKVMRYRRATDPAGQKLYEQNVEKLSNFAALDAAKAEVIKKALSQAEVEVSALMEANPEVTADNIRNSNLTNDGKGTYPSGLPFQVNAKDVAKRLVNPGSTSGMYSVLASVEKAVDGMSTLAKKAGIKLDLQKGAKLVGERAEVGSRLQKISDDIKNLESKIRKTTDEKEVSRLKNKMDSLQRQREDIRAEVDTKKAPIEEEVLPTPGEVATKIATGEEITAADAQVQANEGAAVEAELQRKAKTEPKAQELPPQVPDQGELPPQVAVKETPEATEEVKSKPAKTTEEPTSPVEADEYAQAVAMIAKLDERIGEVEAVIGDIKTDKVAIKNRVSKNKTTVAQLRKIIKRKGEELGKLKKDRDALKGKKSDPKYKRFTSLMNRLLRDVYDAMDLVRKVLAEVRKVAARFGKEIKVDMDKLKVLDTRIKEETVWLRRYKEDRAELVEKIASFRTKNLLESNKGLSKIVETSGRSTVLATDPMGWENVDGVKELFGILKNKFTVEKENYTDSPARRLMDSNGKFYANAVAAMRKNIDEWLLNNGSYILERNPTRVAGMLGITEENVTSEAMNRLGDKAFKKLIANSLGKGILADLGMQGRKDADEVAVDRLISDLGHMALIAAGELGLVSSVDGDKDVLTAEEYAKLTSVEGNITGADITLISILDKGRKFIKNRTNHTRIKELNELLNTEDKSKGAVWRRLKDREVATDKNVVFDTPTKSQEAVNKLEKEEWTFDQEVYDLMMENIDYVKRELGFMKIELDSKGNETGEITKLSKLDRESQIAKNNAIDLGLSHLTNLGEDVKTKGNTFFFKWFFSVNGRFFMDSNTANPQTNKMTRFIVGMKKNSTEVMFSDKKKMDVFYTAIAQAFDFGIDKKKSKDVIAFGKMHAEMDPQDMIDSLVSGQIEVEDVVHALQVVNNVKKLQAAKAAGSHSFVSNLTLETDAVTSGIMLKMLQMPILKNVKEWLTKGGITFGGEARTNELIAGGKITDAYKTIAKKFIDAQFGIVDRAVAIANEVAQKAGSKGVSPTKVAKLEAAHKLLPALLKDGQVTSDARNLFKPVLMVFGYGGGIAGIIKKFNGETIEALPTAALKELLEDAPGKAVAALVSVNALPSLVGLTPGSYTNEAIEAAIEALRETDVLSNESYAVKGNKATAREDLHVNMKLLYGSTITEILESEFGPIMEANRTINNTTRMMFRMYDVMYKEKLAEFRKENKRNPSVEDKIEIYKSLREFFPAVKAPFSTDESKAIVVGQGLESGEQKYGVSTQGNFVSADGKPQATSVVQIMVRKFEESISSGNVNLIHYLDASILAEAILDTDFLPVHDAHIVGVGQAVRANRTYNNGVYKHSTKYSLVDALYESYTRAYNAMSPKQRAEVTPIEGAFEEITADSQLVDLNLLRDNVQAARDEFYAQDMSMDHMTGLGAVTTHKGGEVNKSNLRTEPDVVADPKTVGKYLGDDSIAVQNLIMAGVKKDSKAGAKVLNSIIAVLKEFERCK